MKEREGEGRGAEYGQTEELKTNRESVGRDGSMFCFVLPDLAGSVLSYFLSYSDVLLWVVLCFIRLMMLTWTTE